MQDTVTQFRRSVAQHGKVLKIQPRRFNKPLTFRTFDGRESPLLDGVRTLSKAPNHVVGIKWGAHGFMLWDNVRAAESKIEPVN